jgi:RNA polymerase sigma factor (sigma-70 family)
MVNVGSETHEALELIGRCLSGDPAATAQFQQRYGELIYGYPRRVFRTPADEAGDFYVFAFEQRRIFRRLRTFEGRAPLRAYLLGFVLDDLVLEWKRSARELDTVSIEALNELPDHNQPLAGEMVSASTGAERLSALLSRVEASKAVVMKLLYVEDYDFTPTDIRQLARMSGRRAREVVAGIDRLRSTVREREAGLKRLEDAVDGVHAWIQLYERRLRRINDDLGSLPPTSVAAERLRQERLQLDRKLQQRQRQRTKVAAQVQRRKVTAPYKEIAALLNTSVGNVASQIARLRQELAAKLGSTDPQYREYGLVRQNEKVNP